MSNPTSNFGWVMPTSTDLVTDLPADFAVFGQGVDTTMADLKGGTTGQILSKATNTDMDFVWIANDQGDITGVTATSPLTGGGTSGAITVGIQDASTSQKGSVQLSDSTSTTSSILAATPTAVKSSYDLAAAAVPKSTATAKGSIFTATASATPAELAVGSNGSTLVADSAATTGLRYSATPSASNPVLNSAMQIAQRGTSISVAASSSPYTLDRWQVATGANQACTVSRQATGDTTNLPNIQYAMRFQRNSGQTGTTGIGLGQSIETVNSVPFAGKTITYSFYARAGANYSPTGGGLLAQVYSGTATDNNILTGFTGGTAVVSTSPALTTTWTRYTATGTVGATATQLGLYFLMTPTGTAGTNDYYEVTGVQIDIGSVALPFRTAGTTYQQELAACQRYYQLIADGITQTIGVGNSYSATAWIGFMNIATTMRVAPTLVQTTGSAYYRIAQNGALSDYSSFTSQNASKSAIRVDVTTVGLTAGQAGYLYTNNASSNVALNAEL